MPHGNTTLDIELPTVASLLVDADSLPSPPLAVLQIIRKADDPDVTLEELARLIEVDVALSVQILRIANSALYSPVSEITTIERALTTLGLRSIRLLALSTSLRMLIPESADAFDTTEIRRRMVISGTLSRKICSVLGRQQQDEAFLAGLLTGLGRVVLAQKTPDLCRLLVEQTGSWPTAAVERRMIGFTTDEVTACLIHSWGLPASICAAVEHRADDIDPNDTALNKSLQVALLAENVLCSGEPEHHLAGMYHATETTLGMSIEETDAWLIDVEPLVAEAAASLQFQFPQVQAHSELLIEATRRMQALTMEAHATIVEGSRQLEVLSRKNLELQHEASTDALTGLPNRGNFDQVLARRIAEYATDPLEDGPVGLLLLDLDHFKAVNDNHGHVVGDDILRMVGDALRSQIRGNDMAARYGGEEFVVIVGDASTGKLFAIAERIRNRIAEIAVHLPGGGTLGVTVSVGGAVLGEVTSDSGADLIARADARLYQAKDSGRNRSLVG